MVPSSPFQSTYAHLGWSLSKIFHFGNSIVNSLVQPLIQIWLQCTFTNDQVWNKLRTIEFWILFSSEFILLQQNILTKSKLGGRGLICFTLLHHCSSLKEPGTGTQTRQEPNGRNGYRGHRSMLLIGLLSLHCLACFLKEPRTTRPGVAPPAMGWPPPHWDVIERTL